MTFEDGQGGSRVSLQRRSIVALAAAATVSALGGCGGASRLPQSLVRPGRIRGIALDALAVFDTGSVATSCERAFPGRGEQLVATWRTRQFEYTWIRTVAGQPYVDFWHVTEDALVYAAKALSLDLSTSTREELMNAWLSLKPWPDSVSALRAMKRAGLRLAILSNFTPTMQRACVHGSGLDDVFDHLLSTDDAGVFKPAPHAYQLAVRSMGLGRGEIAFAAFEGGTRRARSVSDSGRSGSIGRRSPWRSSASSPT